MIKRKAKICKECGRPSLIFGKGLCEHCYYIELAKNYKAKKSKAIPKVSKRQKEKNAKYRDDRADYLDKHKLCEANIEGICITKASEIHHKEGRAGENMYNHFLAVCPPCHIWIENNPEEAKERNFSQSRLKRK